MLPNKALGKVSLRIWLPLLIVRGGYAFSLGLYLFVSRLVTVDALKACGATEQSAERTATYMLALTVGLSALLEYPTGVIGDLMGRKFATTVSFLFRGVFFAAMFAVWYGGAQQWAPEVVLGAAVVAWALFSCGYSFLSGAFLAWVQDALDEDGVGDRFTFVLSWGQLAYWLAFPLGTVLALYLYGVGLAQFAFLLGMGVCLSVALACALMMSENRHYPFARLRDLFGKARSETLANSHRIWAVGWRLFRSDRRLWAIAAVGAAVATLVDLVDYTWTDYCREKFHFLKQGNGAHPSLSNTMLVVAAFTLAELLGHLVMLGLITRWEKRGVALDGVTMTWCNVVLNILFVAPIFLVAILVPFLGEPLDRAFLVFAGLMFVHKMVEGGAQTPRESLDNAFIPSQTQERSTVLSLLALLRNLASVLMLLLLGYAFSEPRMQILGWSVPASLVLVLTPVLLFVGLRLSGGPAAAAATPAPEEATPARSNLADPTAPTIPAPAELPAARS